MPLPASNPNTPWPPAELKPMLPKISEWAAWWAGDPEALRSVYGNATANADAPSGGIVSTIRNAVGRWFWGEQGTANRSIKLHVPIAAEICQASADLLFADQVKFTVDDKTAQARLDDLTGDGLHAVLASAAEVAAALGGTYLRVVWDKQADPDAAFLARVDADQVLPEFKWGRLRAATFWSVVKRDGKHVWRLLERHELDAAGVGVIVYGLYMGEDDKLGERVPLNSIPETGALSALVAEREEISSLTPGLTVAYVPNQFPNRRWRLDTIGRHLGRSDLDGVEQLMDALDEVFTSWMRDIRLGKARILAAKSLLKDLGTGKGQAFDADQEVFTPVEKLASGSTGGNSLSEQLHAQQFAIRVNEHEQTATAFVQEILRAAGYSLQTFGMAEQSGGDTTKAEVEARERRSLMTRSRKIRSWRPALEQIIAKLLTVDAAVFNTGVKLPKTGVTVEFPDGVQETQLAIAQTLQALWAAQAASLRTRVEMLHPEWEEKEIAAEVEALKEEFGHEMQSPGGLPLDPNGLPYPDPNGLGDGGAPTVP